MYHPHPLPATHHLPSTSSTRVDYVPTSVRTGELRTVLAVAFGDDGGYGHEVRCDHRAGGEEGEGEEEGVGYTLAMTLDREQKSDRVSALYVIP
jgi:hypothetical protein